MTTKVHNQLKIQNRGMPYIPKKFIFQSERGTGTGIDFGLHNLQYRYRKEKYSWILPK